MNRIRLIVLLAVCAAVPAAGPLDAQIRPTDPLALPKGTDPEKVARITAVQPAVLTLTAGAGSGTVTLSGYNLGVLGSLEVRADSTAIPLVAVRASWSGSTATSSGTTLASTRKVSITATADALPGRYSLRTRMGTAGYWIEVPLQVQVQAASGGAAASGRYRLTLNGFTVNRATWDHALQVDGKGDEVYFTAYVREGNASGGAVARDRQPTPIYGDVNGFSGRLRAGNASSLGGLVSGNSYPTSTPWRRNTTPQPLRLPWVLWEGMLTQGESYVLLLPAVWEWDGGTSVHAEWLKFAREVCDAFVLSPGVFTATGGWGNVVAAVLDVALIGALALHDAQITGQAQDRPVGLDPLSGTYRYRPRPILLTYGAAAALARADGGKGAGVFSITYQDPDNLRGNYTLYYQVERIP